MHSSTTDELISQFYHNKHLYADQQSATKHNPPAHPRLHKLHKCIFCRTPGNMSFTVTTIDNGTEQAFTTNCANSACAEGNQQFTRPITVTSANPHDKVNINKHKLVRLKNEIMFGKKVSNKDVIESLVNELNKDTQTIAANKKERNAQRETNDKEIEFLVDNLRKLAFPLHSSRQKEGIDLYLEVKQQLKTLREKRYNIRCVVETIEENENPTLFRLIQESA